MNEWISLSEVLGYLCGIGLRSLSPGQAIGQPPLGNGHNKDESNDPASKLPKLLPVRKLPSPPLGPAFLRAPSV